ncbi:sigma-70 family RNA polymerase sigma factor [Rubripirellula reticaptiva]|uniref:RNA polymerase sigma factor n=1 Tax=Rubripirellula reticaptiva TaxID=2528013 RepID=A0A5C6EW28_9BACT|nr:sigma-70 family RNA polymerase sigma factor [Rubripirellula reticaptiva]TWU51876.1 RNA polymerase sigma factor [Rubripirellula reticaptiva]
MSEETNDLTHLARPGDESSLADLFQQHRVQLRSMVAFRMDANLRSRVDPSDVIQESFLDLAKRFDDFKSKQEMSPLVWMRLVTMERLMAVHRRHVDTQMRDARRDVSIDRDMGFGATSVSLAAALMDRLSSASGKLIRSEQKAKLHELLEQMDPDDREIIALRIFEGVTNGEAAEILKLTKQTTSKRFVRAIERLRSKMQDIPGLTQWFSKS